MIAKAIKRIEGKRDGRRERGSFIPLGSASFGLFSLFEHLLWVMQATPAALLVVAGGLPGFVLGTVVSNRTKPTLRGDLLHMGISLASGVVSVFAAFKWHSATLFVAAVIFFVVAVVLRLRTIVPPQRQRALMFCGALFFALALAMAFGIDQTRYMLNAAEPARFELDGGNVKDLILVRSGERGMLLYDRAAGEFLVYQIRRT